MTPARKQGSSGGSRSGRGSRGGGATRRSAAAREQEAGLETAEDIEVEGAEIAEDGDELPRAAGKRGKVSPRRGAKRTVMDVVMQLPHYLRLLFGLVTDRRVEALDKLLVVGAIAYIISPLDFVPDFLPFFGQVDDAFLLIASIERLISNAGRRVVMAHWHGDPDDLSSKSLRLALVAASFFLPRRIRRRLRGMVL